jgi:hypothetical protein
LGTVFESNEEAQQHDLFPFVQMPPILDIDRGLWRDVGRVVRGSVTDSGYHPISIRAANRDSSSNII